MTQIEEIDSWLENMVTGLLESAKLDIWVSELYFDEDSRSYIVQLDGPDKGLVIGKEGQVLDSLQHFVRT